MTNNNSFFHHSPHTGKHQHSLVQSTDDVIYFKFESHTAPKPEQDVDASLLLTGTLMGHLVHLTHPHIFCPGTVWPVHSQGAKKQSGFFMGVQFRLWLDPQTHVLLVPMTKYQTKGRSIAFHVEGSPLVPYLHTGQHTWLCILILRVRILGRAEIFITLVYV